MNHLVQLQQIFGYADFRFPQLQLIERTLMGYSTLALMPTGAGKSLVYQYLATLCDQNEMVLVVSPLIALMQDQTEKAKSFHIQSALINSSLSYEERVRRMQLVAEHKIKLLFVAPERFQKNEFWDCLRTVQIKAMVVDEAHCVSIWGHDFRPDYSKLQSYRERIGLPPLLALTATATGDVQDDILRQFKLSPKEDIILGGIERPNLALRTIDCYGADAKNEILLKNLNSESTIIYFSLIQTLESVSRFLAAHKIEHVKYHGDLSRDLRKKNQTSFLRSEKQLILATPAFGLGIDKPDIRQVIHYEVPASIEAYFQEVGRAGRDGAEAAGLFLYDQEDLSIQMQFLDWAYPDREFISKVYDLISNRQQQVASEGMDFLREQMVFKNRKDFRVNAAVAILQRWGCLEEAETPFGFIASRPPTEVDFKMEDQALLKKAHQKKLLEILRYIQNDQLCRLQQIYRYFGHVPARSDCGLCDVCRR